MCKELTVFDGFQIESGKGKQIVSRILNAQNGSHGSNINAHDHSETQNTTLVNM